MINNAMWQRALDYPIDNIHSEYGFGTRLASENYWTINFTQRAILEYRKFMFLAANSDLMVSPSPVVDVVWHEHLTFTQSYHEFCDILGKQIQHVPSTRDSQDVERFRLARERTIKLYEPFFGEQPKDVWGFTGMYESLELPKARINVRGSVIVGILMFIALLVPVFFALLPIYARIPSVRFLTAWIALAVLSGMVLEMFNKRYLKRIVGSIDRASFLNNLHPLEVIYVKTQKLPHVVNALLNQLIHMGKVGKRNDGFYSDAPSTAAATAEQYQALNVLEKWPGSRYEQLMRLLQAKPAIENVSNSIDAVQKYMIKSAKFGKLFYANLAVLSIVHLVGSVRLLTGLSRGRPSEVIGGLLFAFTAFIIVYLYRLPGRVLTEGVTQLYTERIRRSKSVDHDVQWQYFLFGAVALSPTLAPDVKQFDDATYGSSSSSFGDSSSDSSCGSSCSSCGGCGGD
jgi:hypothetical protein